MNMKTGKTIVALHGWAKSANNQAKWQPFLDQLSAAGHDVHFLGLPGLSTTIETPWTLADYVSWLRSQLEQLAGEQPVVLIGHSFGGQLSIRFAATYPQKVDRLILIDSAGIRDMRPLKRLKRGVFWLLAKAGRIFHSVPWARSALYKLARERDYFEASPVLRQTMQNVLNDQVTEDLHLITLPTLILWGARDQATPLFLGHCLHAGIVGSQLHVIPEARHSPHFTHTSQTVGYINHFLNGTPEEQA